MKSLSRIVSGGNSLEKKILQKLPINIIVCEIFKFLLINDYYNEKILFKRKYDGFGIFTKNKIRYIYKLFNCLEINWYPKQCPIFLDNITFLRMSNLNVIKISFFRKMVKLEELNLVNISVNLSSLFKDVEFINLKRLYLSFCENTIIESNWKEESLKNICSLTLKNVLNMEVLFKEHKFLYLKKLYVINYVTLDRFVWKNLSKKLRILCIKNCPVESENIFHFFEFPLLENLCLIHVNYLGENWKLLYSLKILEINCCDEFNDSFFKYQNVENIRNLRIYFCKSITGLHWRKFKNIHNNRIYINGYNFETYKFIDQQNLTKNDLNNVVIHGKNKGFMIDLFITPEIYLIYKNRKRNLLKIFTRIQ